MSTSTVLPPALISFRGLADVLNRSLASLARDDALGRIPRGVRIGGSRRWDPLEIQRWIDAGCPHRAEWEASKRQGRK
jgi:hypothetical protein